MIRIIIDIEDYGDLRRSGSCLQNARVEDD